MTTKPKQNKFNKRKKGHIRAVNFERWLTSVITFQGWENDHKTKTKFSQGKKGPIRAVNFERWLTSVVTFQGWENDHTHTHTKKKSTRGKKAPLSQMWSIFRDEKMTTQKKKKKSTRGKRPHSSSTVSLVDNWPQRPCFRAEETTFNQREKAQFEQFCATYVTDLLPYLNRCLQALFPASQLAHTLGISLIQLNKMVRGLPVYQSRDWLVWVVLGPSGCGLCRVRPGTAASRQ